MTMPSALSSRVITKAPLRLRNALLAMLLAWSSSVGLLAGEDPAAPQTVNQPAELAAKLNDLHAEIAGLNVRGHELMAAAGHLFLCVDNGEPVRIGPELNDFRATLREGIHVWEGCHPRLPVTIRAEWKSQCGLSCRIQLTGQVQPRAAAQVELRLPLKKTVLQVLAPSGDDRHSCDFTRSLAFAFRGHGRGLVMPAAVLYHPEEDWGLTAMADFVLPTRGFELALQPRPAALIVRRVDLRLEPGKPVDVSIILAGHAGDWRPGLGEVVARHREFFEVADPRLPKLHGPFVCGGGAPKDETIDRWKAQGVQTVEVHGTLPFYGQHLPLGQRWTIFADDVWHRLREKTDPARPADDAPWQTVLKYIQEKVPPNISADQVRDYIRRLHQRGMYALMYFNPTEAWKLWVKEQYPEAIVHTAAGKPIPVWYESLMVCPDPESRWGRHLLEEFTKMMDLYPEADGFFMDQSCYDNLDYAHDDGWSISAGRTGYRMGWAINQIAARCRELARPKGKFLWWNGPYNVNIARYAEGMMAEAGNEAQVRTISYLTLGGRACCTLSQKGEEVFQNCAAYGLYPTAMGSSELSRLATRYRPIIDLFAGKRWIFHPRAVELPPGSKGNIWRLPNGDALAVAVRGDRRVDGSEFELDVPLVIRLPDAAKVRAAYLLSPDLLGKRRLPLVRDGETLRVVLPRHQSVSAVLLACSGVHLALEGAFEVLPGRPIDATAIVDNFSAERVSGTWTTADAPSFTVEPGGQSRQTVRLKTTGDARRQVAGQLAATVGGQPLGGPVEVVVEQPLSARLLVPGTPVAEDAAPVVRLSIVNMSGPRRVNCRLTAKCARVEPAQITVTAAARSCQEVLFHVFPQGPGQVEVAAHVTADSDRATSSAPFDVHATKASPDDLKRIRTGLLLFDSAGSNHGDYRDKPLLLNGVRLDVLPAQDDNWQPVEMRLSPEALRTLKATNEIRIENRPGDAFKVRNFRLHLWRDDSLLIVSQTNHQAYTSCGWEFQEGKVFRLREPLTGIFVTIPAR